MKYFECSLCKIKYVCVCVCTESIKNGIWWKKNTVKWTKKDIKIQNLVWRYIT